MSSVYDSVVIMGTKELYLSITNGGWYSNFDSLVIFEKQVLR